MHDFSDLANRTVAYERDQEETQRETAPLGLMADYEPSMRELLEHEGGNDDDPQDPGGRTSRGILQREYDRYRIKKGLPQRDVWLADQAEVLDIYRTDYWDRLRCDDLPAGIDYPVFDYGVNSGVGRAARVLQRVLHRPVDGKIGYDTLAAARAAEAKTVIHAICDERLAFLKKLRHWPRFRKGWARRVADVRAAALKMAVGAPAARPRAPSPIAAPAGTAAAGGAAGAAAHAAGAPDWLALLIVGAFVAAGIVLFIRARRRRAKPKGVDHA